MFRRAVASTACAALVVAVVAARADEASDALIKKAQQAATAAKALEADLLMTQEYQERKTTFNGTVRLMRPNYAQIKLRTTTGAMQTLMSDGKNTFRLLETNKQYLKNNAPANGEGLSLDGPHGAVAAFFNPASIAAGTTHRAGPAETIEGKQYQVVVATAEQRPQQRKLYFGSSGLLEGVELRSTAAEGTFINTSWLKNIKLNPELTAQQFAYTPPADFKPYAPPNYEANLIAVGQPAPDFQLPQPGGTQLALADARKGKKAVLINFWFHG